MNPYLSNKKAEKYVNANEMFREHAVDLLTTVQSVLVLGLVVYGTTIYQISTVFLACPLFILQRLHIFDARAAVRWHVRADFPHEGKYTYYCRERKSQQ
jgi:hypothetical protein